MEVQFSKPATLVLEAPRQSREITNIPDSSPYAITLCGLDANRKTELCPDGRPAFLGTVNAAIAAVNRVIPCAETVSLLTREVVVKNTTLFDPQGRPVKPGLRYGDHVVMAYLPFSSLRRYSALLLRAASQKSSAEYSAELHPLLAGKTLREAASILEGLEFDPFHTASGGLSARFYFLDDPHYHPKLWPVQPRTIAKTRSDPGLPDLVPSRRSEKSGCNIGFARDPDKVVEALHRELAEQEDQLAAGDWDTSFDKTGGRTPTEAVKANAAELVRISIQQCLSGPPDRKDMDMYFRKPLADWAKAVLHRNVAYFDAAIRKTGGFIKAEDPPRQADFQEPDDIWDDSGRS